MKFGLGDAVLELHSNKTDRKSVLTRLGRGWDRSSGATEEGWIQVTEDLKLSRDHLNAYVQALHAKGTQGFSVFDAVARVASGEAPFKIFFDSKDAHDVESYRHLVSLAAELGRTHAAVGSGPALSFVHSEHWSFKWETEFVETVESLCTALGNLRQAEHTLARELGLRSDPNLGAKRRARLRALAPRMESAALDLSAVSDMPAERLSALAKTFATDVGERAAAMSRTVAMYSLDAAREMPFERLDASWREAQTKFWPASAVARRRVRKLLQTLRRQRRGRPWRGPEGALRGARARRRHSREPLGAGCRDSWRNGRDASDD